MQQTTGWKALVVVLVVANFALMYGELTRDGGLLGRRILVPLYTGQQGGAFLPLGEDIGRIIAGDADTNLELLPIPSNGSVANLETIASRPDAISFTFVRLPDLAVLKAAANNVRAIATISRDVLRIVARKGVVESLEELGAELSAPAARNTPGQTSASKPSGRCKYRVYVGLEGSGTRETAREVLREASLMNCFREWEEASNGLSYSDVSRMMNSTAQDSADRSSEVKSERIAAGNVGFDAAIFATGKGANAVEGLLNSEAFVLLGIGERIAGELVKLGYDKATVGNGQPERYETVSARVLVATHASTQDWIVQELAEAIERHQRELEDLTSDAGIGEAVITAPSRLQELLSNGNLKIHPALHEFHVTAMRRTPVRLALTALLWILQIYLVRRIMPLVPDDRRVFGISPPRRVFISFDHGDAKFVNGVLVPRLEAAGVSVWWSGLLPVGGSFPRLIKTAITNATWVVAVLSPRTARSGWVTSELEVAFQAGKCVAPVLLRPCNPSVVHPRLADLHALDLSVDTDGALAALVAQLLTEPGHASGRPGSEIVSPNVGAFS